MKGLLLTEEEAQVAEVGVAFYVENFPEAQRDRRWMGVWGKLFNFVEQPSDLHHYMIFSECTDIYRGITVLGVVSNEEDVAKFIQRDIEKRYLSRPDIIVTNIVDDPRWNHIKEVEYVVSWHDYPKLLYQSYWYEAWSDGAPFGYKV